MANVQIAAAVIASITSLIIAGLALWMVFKKEKALKDRVIEGELGDYKDYELITITGKQLKEYKEKMAQWQQN